VGQGFQKIRQFRIDQSVVFLEKPPFRFVQRAPRRRQGHDRIQQPQHIGLKGTQAHALAGQMHRGSQHFLQGQAAQAAMDLEQPF